MIINMFDSCYPKKTILLRQKLVFCQLVVYLFNY